MDYQQVPQVVANDEVSLNTTQGGGVSHYPPVQAHPDLMPNQYYQYQGPQVMQPQSVSQGYPVFNQGQQFAPPNPYRGEPQIVMIGGMPPQYSHTLHVD